MTSDREKIAESRTRLKARYKGLYSEIEQILFKHDPIGIAYVDHEFVADNPDEYAPEVDTILPRLASAKSANEVTNIVHEEFVNWFGDAGPKENYRDLSVEIWETWVRFKGEQE